MVSREDAAAELLRRREARKSVAEYISYTNPRYKRSWFSDSVCAELDRFILDVQAGKRPILILQAPPQHGKSEIVSRRLPAFLLGKFPDLRVGAASYNDDLVSGMSRDVRRTLASPEHQKLFPISGLRTKFDIDRTTEFNMPGAIGGYVGVGIGGGLSGRPVDCLVAGTLVETDHGQKCIEKLEIDGSACKVLSFSKKEGLHYANVKAFASSKRLGIYRIHTERGSILETTGGHRFYTPRGYVKASKLAIGEILMSAVRERTNQDGGGLQKVEGEILLTRVRGFRNTHGPSLQRLWRDFAEKPCGSFLCRMFTHQKGQQKQSLSPIRKDSIGLPHVSKLIRICKSRSGKVFDVLRESMRRSRPCFQDVFGWKSEVEKWGYSFAGAGSFGQSLPDNKTRDSTSRRLFLRTVQGFRQKIRGSSYRRECSEQRVIEFSDSLCSMPSQSSQADGWTTEADRVVRIETVCKEAVVYDIQVENSHNFFANGILVHNCGIIDDPIKDQQEALSPKTKGGVWDWYQTVFTTRLSENSGQIIMATSWAEDDLAGRIMSEMAGNPRVKVLKFPAINRQGEAGYNPDLPEGPLVPQLHSLAKLEETKALLSDYWWACIYQQSPRALGGNVFKEAGVQYYFKKDLPAKFDKVIASWDCTFKDTDGTDFVTGGVWAKAGASSYLLDQTRARMSFTKTVKEVKDLRDRWPQIRETLIEDKANGPAVIDTLKTVVPGLIAVEPDGSKLARAHAVTWVWEALNVFLPHPSEAPWVKDFVAELLSFPAAAHDDQVDQTTQALRRLYPAFQRLKISQDAINRAMGVAI